MNKNPIKTLNLSGYYDLPFPCMQRKSKECAAQSPACGWALLSTGQVKAGLPWEAGCTSFRSLCTITALLWPSLAVPGIRESPWISQHYRHISNGQVLLSTPFQTSLLGLFYSSKYKVKLQICFNMVKLFFIALPRLWYTHLTHALNPSNTMIRGEQVNLPPQRWNTKQKRQHP